MSSLLHLALVSILGAPVAIAIQSYRRRRWARRPVARDLVTWAEQRGFRVTDGADMALVDGIQRVLDVAGRPGDTAGGSGVGPSLDDLIGDDLTPTTPAEVGIVLAGVDGTVLFEVWADQRTFVYAATPGSSDWISLELGAEATGPGVGEAITDRLLVGLAHPARVRCGHGWLTVSASSALGADTGAVLLERLADLRAAVTSQQRL
jgi:hypothetical protein